MGASGRCIVPRPAEHAESDGKRAPLWPRRSTPLTENSKRIIAEQGESLPHQWEVFLNDRWVRFEPGCRFNDKPGSKQHIVMGTFWYRLVFDTNGVSGMQTNLSTNESRLLRKASAGSRLIDQ